MNFAKYKEPPRRSKGRCDLDLNWFLHFFFFFFSSFLLLEPPSNTAVKHHAGPMPSNFFVHNNPSSLCLHHNTNTKTFNTPVCNIFSPIDDSALRPGQPPPNQQATQVIGDPRCPNRSRNRICASFAPEGEPFHLRNLPPCICGWKCSGS